MVGTFSNLRLSLLYLELGNLDLPTHGLQRVESKLKFSETPFKTLPPYPNLGRVFHRLKFVLVSQHFPSGGKVRFFFFYHQCCSLYFRNDV